MTDFSKEELKRYARHFAIPDFGTAGQARLKAGRVLVIGAGGLGSPVLLYLAAAGVGKIGIVDFDQVDLTNLQRQVLYTTADIGKLKVEVAKKRLLAINPHLDIRTYPVALTRDNVMELFAEYDIIADGTDNFPTRYLVNDACVLSGKVNVYASIFRFEGQVSVFNLPHEDGSRGHNYRDLYPTPPPPDMVPNCAEGGVLGVLPGIIGSLQASEVIKILSGFGDPLSGRLFLFDAAAFTSRVMKFPKDPNTRITELVDYDAFCGLPATTRMELPEMTIEAFTELQGGDKAFQLVDVREAYEYEADNLGGHHIPLGELAARLGELDPGRMTVVHCQSGQRSAKAVQLMQEHGFKDIYNLAGGINAWNQQQQSA
ncbi:molybdopterin-synthase adenylyltransferase MoeB [Flavilitoribacter nigricans]|nr:molybdopterin-synthase adenylyltransferase MoeB [Flavilitoribacter nigricans]